MTHSMTGPEPGEASLEVLTRYCLTLETEQGRLTEMLRASEARMDKLTRAMHVVFANLQDDPLSVSKGKTTLRKTSRVHWLGSG